MIKQNIDCKEKEKLKIVINTCYGGFGLSQEAMRWLINNKGWKIMLDGIDKNEKTKYQLCSIDSDFAGSLYLNVDRYDLIFRSNPDLVEVVETLGEEVNDIFSSLTIKEVEGYSLDQLEINEHDEYETLQTIPVRF